jgi:ElaB/YqjD/DUF883 family membrane-anchored ribosome-binding protein
MSDLDNTNEQQPANGDEVTLLKNEIKTLHETMEKMLDSIAQTTATQNQLAKAALKAKETADAAMAELSKTKSELAATKMEMHQTMQAALPAAIKQGMTGFAEEVKKANDERITAILGQGQPQPGAEGQPTQGPIMVRQNGGGFDLGSIISAIAANADGIAKLMAGFRPPAPPVAPWQISLLIF